ncbi:ATP-binding protein [Mesorhizobium sp. ES1-6]|uniref:ATP-binding protein n=1 Tax=Mesorhizobium sp. ES1-6 TaxID=2876626 RepID=UPI001CCD071B|nr:ATP-binding protein [Mesorhizobium sp. ES1-6]MBZ9801179.1 ATP-binding protein [Mesorhizobium sp. ES1-6]
MAEEVSLEPLATPSTSNVSFKTRARTIDHLGRGQIADAPTAVSELWKNAWDAYATNVSLNIFDGATVVAAVFDDGVGMSASDFVDRWLVIGTESKVDGPPAPPPADFDGPARQRQGEKGIGRLSAAFLAPATLVLSQRQNGSIAAVLVDWRLFENPFLSLDQIVIPVRTFSDHAAVLAELPLMVKVVLSNLGSVGEDDTRVLTEEWQRFADDEAVDGKNSTAGRILEFWKELPLQQRHLDEWPVTADISAKGTALYLLGAHHELSVWLEASHEDQEAKNVKERLTDILTGFTDTLTDYPVAFGYEVLTFRGATPRRVVSSTDVFDLDDFHQLEHTVEGRFDDAGVFRGTVHAFGQDLGERIIPPQRPLPKGRGDKPGPFDFAIGTFEQLAVNSSHNARRHKDLADQVEKYGGVRVYRDGLRVMPYGSADADFFALEEKRQKHAGRYFWAHRRSFGRLAFSRVDNPGLRDKAGREGLVENRASRELRLLVQDLLIKLAADYFGTDAPERSERLVEAQKRNQKGRKAADQARKARKSAFRQYLASASARMPSISQRAQSVSKKLDDATSLPNREALAFLRGELERTRAEIAEVTPLDVPNNLGEAEQTYRNLRDEIDEASDLVRLSEETLLALEAAQGAASPKEVARAVQLHHRKAVDEVLDGYQGDVREGFRALMEQWTANLADDHTRYERATAPIVRDVTKATNLADVLALLETNRLQLETEFAERYRPIIRNVGSIVEGVDIETALAAVDDDREDLDRRVRDLNAVAQLGITVEIIGHELESLDGEVSRNLEMLPSEVKGRKAYRQALEAHRALTEKLRFLSPLQLAGARIRERVTGRLIGDYVREFFGSTFEDNEILFETTPAFDAIGFTEMRSRIFPVFINLVNNAIYWVARSAERIVRLDFVDGKVVVADTGPGVDRDDVWRLFQLFFTKRSSGRGVGLYLSRVNLEAGRHAIRYAEASDPHVLPGANFIIELRGVSDGNGAV